MFGDSIRELIHIELNSLSSIPLKSFGSWFFVVVVVAVFWSSCSITNKKGCQKSPTTMTLDLPISFWFFVNVLFIFRYVHINTVTSS